MRSLLLSLLLLLSCFRNHPPDPPEITGGPAVAFPDSTCTFHIHVTDPDGDNVRLRVAWDGGDTLGWSDFVASGESISVSHAWDSVGTYAVTAQARDVHDSASAWSEASMVSVVLPFPFRVKDTIHLSCSPMHLAILPDGSFLYVGSDCRDWVWVVRTADYSVVDSILVCSSTDVADLVASPDGARVYVICGDNRLLVIRTADNVLEDSTTVMEDGSPTGLALLPDGRRLYVSSWYGEHLIEVQTEPLVVTDSIQLGRSNVSGVLSSVDGRFIYALCGPAQVASTETRLVVKKLEVGARTGACLPDSSLVYLCESSGTLHVVRPSDHEVIRSIDFHYATALAPHPSSRWLYVADWDGMLTVLQTSDHAVLGTLGFGPGTPLVDVVCGPNGEQLYVADADNDVIYVLGR